MTSTNPQTKHQLTYLARRLTGRLPQASLSLDKLALPLQRFVAQRITSDALQIQHKLKLSIIIPSFNQGDFLERTLLSILNQNYSPLELIIIDGGSTDNTLDIIDKYKNEITLWVSEPDKGQADALNKGIRVATGDIIGWQNSDDLYFPGAFHAMAEKFVHNPSCSFVSGTVASIDSDENILRLGKFCRPTIQRLLYEGFVLSSQGVFWRRNIHNKVGYFDANLHHAMDYELWLKMLKHSNAEFLPQLIGAFRIHNSSKTSLAGYNGTLEVNRVRQTYGIDTNTLDFRVKGIGLRLSRLARWYITTRTQLIHTQGH